MSRRWDTIGSNSTRTGLEGNAPVLSVEVISTEELGDRSYVAHDGELAVVIDPQRDIDRVEEVLSDRGLTCELVLETHMHNDYVTGGLELSRLTGARYGVAASETVGFERLSVSDGDELTVGSLTVRAVATPGHTDGHTSYVVTDIEGSSAVFTGGSLLYGSVGRTDLVDPSRTEELTRSQYRSVRNLADQLDESTPVFPTHGFGSFCSSGAAVGGEQSTVGVERRRNDALVIDDEDQFVKALVAGLTAYPSYYARMGPINRRGPEPVDLSLPELADAAVLVQRISAGEWVVDLRTHTAFVTAYLGGTIGIPLGPFFTTYLGWLLPDDMPLTLLGESVAQIAAARRQLVRIGIDRPGASTEVSPERLAALSGLGQYAVKTFDDLRGVPEAVVVDVRLDHERQLGFVDGSHHIPLHQLLDRMDDLPEGVVWVHCAAGYRAAIAASLLDRSGRDVVLIYDDALASGLAPGGSGKAK
jgi:glyoxylase-like metal-dependent hydrolase (beta-lactamase superfamily II)/rhodanese-related sulfurtransferase